MEIFKQDHFLDYRTVPHSTLDLIGRVLMEVPTRLWVGEFKPSHFWTWEKIVHPENLRGHFIQGDPSAPSQNPLDVLNLQRFSKIIGCQEICVIEPKPDRIIEYCQFGFWLHPNTEKKLVICRVALPPDQAFKILVGQDSMYVCVIGSDNLEVPVNVPGPLERDNPNFRDTVLI